MVLPANGDNKMAVNRWLHASPTARACRPYYARRWALMPANDGLSLCKRALGRRWLAQPFNRQDVDAIYLYASPLEAGIIKSFIDISQSPFAPAPRYYLSAKGNPGFNNPRAGKTYKGCGWGICPGWLIPACHCVTRFKPYGPKPITTYCSPRP